MSTATLTKNTTFAPMLPIFAEEAAVPTLAEDRELCKSYLRSWGKSYGSETTEAGVISMEDFKSAADRLYAAAA